MKRQGLFKLQTPRNLLEKARYDLERLRENENDAYAAFDFFVTVRHIPDWLFPRDRQQSEALFEKYVELRVCRHIADQAKHFEVTRPQHSQVAYTSVVPSSFQSDAVQGSASQTEELIIQLDPKDPGTASLGSRVKALLLAERVFSAAEKIVGQTSP